MGGQLSGLMKMGTYSLESPMARMDPNEARRIMAASSHGIGANSLQSLCEGLDLDHLTTGEYSALKRVLHYESAHTALSLCSRLYFLFLLDCQVTYGFAEPG